MILLLKSLLNNVVNKISERVVNSLCARKYENNIVHGVWDERGERSSCSRGFRKCSRNQRKTVRGRLIDDEMSKCRTKPLAGFRYCIKYRDRTLIARGSDSCPGETCERFQILFHCDSKNTKLGYPKLMMRTFPKRIFKKEIVCKFFF